MIIFGTHIPIHSFYAMMGIVGLLFIASVTQLIIIKNNPNKDYSELKDRIRSWWWTVGILFTCFIIGKTAIIVLFSFISFMALKEFFSITQLKQSDRRVIFWSYLAIPVQYYWIVINWYGMFIIFIPVYMFLFFSARMVLIGEIKGFIKSISIIHWVTMTSVFSLSHIAYLLLLPVKDNTSGSIGLILFLIFLTQFNDVAQYVWGKALGKHSIIPKVSPNKTWEGFLGGVLTVTIISGFMALLLTPLSIGYGFLAGFIISVAGFFGDVVISAVKRDLNIKDSGTLIPGHGEAPPLDWTLN